MDEINSLPANRSTALELAEERRLVEEGHQFLDEKRMLLAAEILRRMARYRQLQHEGATASRSARAALGNAIAVLGLDAVLLAPTRPLEGQAQLLSEPFMGVRLVRLAAPLLRPVPMPAPAPAWPSAALEEARRAFQDLLSLAAALGVEATNLRRLAREYRRTERRARALENVLLPELDLALRFVGEQLELQESEEAIRVHEARRAPVR